jgi:aminopeptidase N
MPRRSGQKNPDSNFLGGQLERQPWLAFCFEPSGGVGDVSRSGLHWQPDSERTSGTRDSPFLDGGGRRTGQDFLSEGWAVWAESAIVENEFGAETAKEFWKYRANMYFLAYDGKASLLEDEGNAGVAYMKGPWLFHMLENTMGKIGFQQAIAEYSSRSLVSPGGWDLLAECAQRHAPADFDARSFLRPWLTEKRAPHLTTQIAGRAVTIHQEPSVFEFPLVIEASTTQGPERRRVWIKGPETVVTFSGDVSDVKIDPDESLLLRR